MKRLILPLTFLLTAFQALSQYRTSTVLNGEFGFAIGGAHYFGDLNNDIRLNRPKIAASLMFRKQFGNYIALRLQGTYGKLGYSDQYSDNETQRIRNLSFNTDFFELALMGDFNFFRFIPGEHGYRFTPFTAIGIGFFTYDPYAFLNDEKYFLRPLGTEGQGTSLYPERQTYGTMAACFPIGVGFKYNLTYRTNFTFEISHRFTNTDYLDDVSLTYAGPNAFPALPNGDPSPAFLLQDRSYELTNRPVGIAGRQRGNSQRNDNFVTVTAGLTFNLTSYKCPSPKY